MLKAEAKLRIECQEQLQFETLLADISALFVNLPTTDIDDEIVKAQQRICECLGIDLSSLWQWSQDTPSYLALTHLYSPPEGPHPENVNAAEAVPWVAAKLKAGETLTINTEELPPEAALDRETRRGFGVKSSVVLPLAAGGRAIIGVLSFDTLWAEKSWSSDTVKRLTLIAQLFTNILERKRYEEELIEKLAEIEKLKTELENENIYFRKELKSQKGLDQIVGDSDTLKYTLFRANQVAETDATVLILGETGTGKGLIANAIHNLSSRRERSMITVNCASLPANLVESELFGREKGAFTGAHNKQVGRFEIADKGTIFLDEIGELPLEIQAKLLRVLQDGEFERLGSPRTVKVDVRVIASTNRDLKAEVCAGLFREDLFYRLNVFPVSLPSLRERREDIPQLARFFIDIFNKKFGRQIISIPKSTIKMMQAYAWPGNIRELEHVIERSVICTAGNVFQITERLDPVSDNGLQNSSLKDLSSVEREHIIKVLEKTNGKIEGPLGAAAILKLNPSTLRFRIKKLQIPRS